MIKKYIITKILIDINLNGKFCFLMTDNNGIPYYKNNINIINGVINQTYFFTIKTKDICILYKKYMLQLSVIYPTIIKIAIDKIISFKKLYKKKLIKKYWEITNDCCNNKIVYAIYTNSGVALYSVGSSTSSITVSDFDELQDACDNAIAGDTIQLANNTKFIGYLKVQNLTGTETNPIKIIGNNTSYIGGSDTDITYKSYCIYVENCQYVYFGLEPTNPINIDDNGEGFYVKYAQKGVYVKNSNYITIQNINVQNIGYEGIHLLSNSCNCLVSNNIVGLPT